MSSTAKHDKQKTTYNAFVFDLIDKTQTHTKQQSATSTQIGCMQYLSYAVGDSQ